MRKLTQVLAAAAAPAVLAAVLLGTAGQASAATQPQLSGNMTDDNWAGYYASPPNNQLVQSVQAMVVVPKITCWHSRGYFPARGSTWVGIGGIAGDPRNFLEQDGVQYTCASPWAAPKYELFHELVALSGTDPHPPIDFKGVTVHPGDRVWMETTINSSATAKSAMYSIAVYQPGQVKAETFNEPEKLPMWANTGHTAEAITEWSSGKGPEIKLWYYDWKHWSGLVDMGQVHYTNAFYTDASGTMRPVTQYKLTLKRNGVRIIWPGDAFASIPSNGPAKDAFVTHYHWYDWPGIGG
jgi:hypothetical protein